MTPQVISTTLGKAKSPFVTHEELNAALAKATPVQQQRFGQTLLKVVTDKRTWGLLGLAAAAAGIVSGLHSGDPQIVEPAKMMADVFGDYAAAVLSPTYVNETVNATGLVLRNNAVQLQAAINEMAKNGTVSALFNIPFTAASTLSTSIAKRGPVVLFEMGTNAITGLPGFWEPVMSLAGFGTKRSGIIGVQTAWKAVGPASLTGPLAMQMINTTISQIVDPVIKGAAKDPVATAGFVFLLFSVGSWLGPIGVAAVAAGTAGLAASTAFQGGQILTALLIEIMKTAYWPLPLP